MRITRTVQRVAAAAVATAALGVFGIGTASATPQNWFGTGGCEAVEDIQLGGDHHEYMRIIPTANPGHCLFGVFDRNAWKWLGAAGATPSSDPSAWYYDGPGQSLQACLIDTAHNNTWACGLIN
ncbi:hypothetical protein [Kitasatospora sp. NPDC093806]|uniref:hypothetical protein n=1 Tax=Kitasatospora sp. NPDC093806 TaxID=3155075 RepID=UPI00341E0F67